MFFVAHKNGNIFSEGDSMVLGTLPESYMIICLWLGGDFPQLQLALSGVPIVAIQGGFECVCLKANLYQEKSWGFNKRLVREKVAANLKVVSR